MAGGGAEYTGTFDGPAEAEPLPLAPALAAASSASYWAFNLAFSSAAVKGREPAGGATWGKGCERGGEPYEGRLALAGTANCGGEGGGGPAADVCAAASSASYLLRRRSFSAYAELST